MFIIPGFLISIATFPGVIVHEAAHMFFCKVRKVPVVDVCFFRFGNPAGYVAHAEIKDFTTAFLVSVGPFIINSLLCIIICFPVYFPMQVFNIQNPLFLFIMWLGLSIGMHAFPSNHDASCLLEHAKKAAAEFNPLAIISFPVILLIFIANLLRFFWFDLIYGAAIGIGLPALIF